MCFSISMTATATGVSSRYNAPIEGELNSGVCISAFDNPKLPVLIQNNTIAFVNWGLVPHWIKNRQDAKDIQNKTLNARCETIFEKPSFKESILQKRCCVPVSSFQEWHHNEDKSKTKYDIKLKASEIFSLAGLWSKWTGPKTNKQYYSFSIITCEANTLMSQIHNSKKRMPVIIPQKEEAAWVNPVSDISTISNLMVPFNSDAMEASIFSV